jgi:hypothetical protein
MPPVLKPMLVRQNREHALQTLVREFHDLPAPLADQVLVIGLRAHRLVALESFAEFVGPDQAALDQEIQRAVHRGQADPLAAVLQLAPDLFHREMIVGKKDYLRDEIALAGNRLMMLAEMTAKSLEKGSSFSLIQARHRD